jgi:hypothetical protein
VGGNSETAEEEYHLKLGRGIFLVTEFPFKRKQKNVGRHPNCEAD